MQAGGRAADDGTTNGGLYPPLEGICPGRLMSKTYCPFGPGFGWRDGGVFPGFDLWGRGVCQGFGWRGGEYFQGSVGGMEEYFHGGFAFCPPFVGKQMAGWGSISRVLLARWGVFCPPFVGKQMAGWGNISRVELAGLGSISRVWLAGWGSISRGVCDLTAVCW